MQRCGFKKGNLLRDTILLKFCEVGVESVFLLVDAVFLLVDAVFLLVDAVFLLVDGNL
jgi:hypothetical protein